MAEITTNNFQETQQLAQKFINDIFLSKKKRKGAIVLALEGDLGSGKTTFVQGLAKALGIKDLITSPTFVLIKKYGITGTGNWEFKPVASLPVIASQLREIKNFYHIDCYRIDKPWQLQELGFEEIINNPKNLVAIEWGEKIAEILSKNKITIKFEWVDEDKRKITFK